VPEIIAGAAALGTMLMGIGTMAAWRQAKANGVEVKTNHGMRAGEYIELIHSDVQELRTLMVEHITDRARHN
jgi:hypothetical protein